MTVTWTLLEPLQRVTQRSRIGHTGRGGQQYLMTLLIIWFEHKNNIKITCFVLVNNLHHTATWWRCNAKLVIFLFCFFKNTKIVLQPSSSFVLPAIRRFDLVHGFRRRPPPPLAPPRPFKRKIIKPFINTGNPAPLSQTHYDNHWHRKHPVCTCPSLPPRPPPHIINEPFSLFFFCLFCCFFLIL